MTTGKYFNRGVMALDSPYIGHVVRETFDKIVVFGEGNDRYDVPKSEIQTTGTNVLIGLSRYQIANKYKVDRNAPLPTGEPVDKINDDAYPESYYYKGSKEEKQEEKNDIKNNNTAKSITDMVIGNNRGDNSYYGNTMPSSTAPIAPLVVDTKTLVAQTQDRMWKALEGRYLYDSSLKDSQDFLFNHVNSKVSLVIMYVDLVGSTKMSMTLPVDSMVTIIRAFTYEMTSTVRSYGGYVLKYVGDAIIAFFPASYNKLLACDKAVQCANSMISVIKNGINPILKQYDYPELHIKIGIDEGDNVILQYGHDKSSLIDILGYSMSITAKLTSLTNPNKITIDEDVYDILHPEFKSKFIEIQYNNEKWKYIDKHTGRIYKLYTLND